jgi:hypothetical protein
MNHSRQSLASLLACGVLILNAPLMAQMPATSNTLLLAMAANAKRLMQYEWKQRITVIRKGNPAQPVIDQVRFGADGQMQRTAISAPEQKEMRGLRGKIAAGVKEDVKEMMELAGRYNKPQQMAAAVKKAQISQTPGTGITRLEANDLIESTDSVTILVNSKTHLATHIDIKTVYDGGLMTVFQDYAPLPDGPNVMKSMRVSAPKKDLVVNVGSYDYVRQSAALRP